MKIKNIISAQFILKKKKTDSLMLWKLVIDSNTFQTRE
jgi:hypothetical protein